MYEWNLDKLYLSYETDEFKNDVLKIDEMIKKTNDLKEELISGNDYESTIEKYLNFEVQTMIIAYKVFNFINLKLSTNTSDEESLKHLTVMQMKFTNLSEINTLFVKYVAKIDNLDDLVNNNDVLKEHEFLLKELKNESRYMLSEETEVILAKLNQTGSSAWSQLQGLLTSTLEVDYKGEIKTLPEIRNLAYDNDQNVRKEAYEAELAAYKKIEKPIASALNSIKGEVNVLTKIRGYESGLDKALKDSRMQKGTLDVMIEAMKDYLPYFRKYLKRKARLLGHENGLPFYDLFAPMGSSSKEFTIEEAREYILNNFGKFGEHLKSLADRAFSENWIDYEPKKGKRGGAFCSNNPAIKESRILTNFTGTFSDVITLSHELGHAYHGDCIFDESILNSNYTMPVAETASTFCETIVMKSAIKDADDEEKIFLLESLLQDYTQVIVDILSRFLFEYNVFEQRHNSIMNEEQLKHIMMQSQLDTYGDGLDKDFLHPYMWVNKGHYYSGSLSFYNFPYAFGLLFAKGLYAKYLKEGDSFIEKYDNLLRKTGQMTVEDVAALVDIDVTKKEFWNSSLEILKEDIELFLSLTE